MFSLVFLYVNSANSANSANKYCEYCEFNSVSCSHYLIPKFKMFVAILTDFKIKFTVLSKSVTFMFGFEPVE